MEGITAEKVYSAFVSGASELIREKDILNEMNVFPVPDGDTGSNLASMMRYILEEARCGDTIKSTFDSIANASLEGSRGNSGIILSQYINSINTKIKDKKNIEYKDIITAAKSGVSDVYKAISNPVEGTMLTVIKEWSESLDECIDEADKMNENFTEAYFKAVEALEKTKKQLKVLKENDVVDAGGKGFCFFLKGIKKYLKNPNCIININESDLEFDEKYNEIVAHKVIDTKDVRNRYCTEAIVESNNINLKKTEKILNEYGDSGVVALGNGRARLHVHTNTPDMLFEEVEKLGIIVKNKIDDMKMQVNIRNKRKYNIAVVTDSTADLPQGMIDDEQVHIINLKINIGDKTYLDKLTINNNILFKKIQKSGEKAYSSQPNHSDVHSKLSWLLTYYEKIIIVTVARELSGTYNTIRNVVEKIDPNFERIKVLDSKTNSGALGLLVFKTVNLVKKGLKLSQVYEIIKKERNKYKILVDVQNLDSMVRSGRLNDGTAKILKKIKVTPIVTLNENGKGKIFSVGLSRDRKLKKLIRFMKKTEKQKGIEEYAFVYTDDKERAGMVAKEIEDVIHKKPKYICQTSSIIANGAGQGAVAIVYSEK